MTRLSVPDMSGGHCRAGVAAAIDGVDAAATVEVNLDTRIVVVQCAARAPALTAALAKVGFAVTPA